METKKCYIEKMMELICFSVIIKVKRVLFQRKKGLYDYSRAYAKDRYLVK